METTSYIAIAGGVESTRTEALCCILKERGRGYASDKEVWAELKLQLDLVKDAIKDAENVHKEMWKAIKESNEDAVAAFMQEFERGASKLAGAFIRISATAKIALEDPEIPQELED